MYGIAAASHGARHGTVWAVGDTLHLLREIDTPSLLTARYIHSPYHIAGILILFPFGVPNPQLPLAKLHAHVAGLRLAALGGADNPLRPLTP